MAEPEAAAAVRQRRRGKQDRSQTGQTGSVAPSTSSAPAVTTVTNGDTTSSGSSGYLGPLQEHDDPKVQAAINRILMSNARTSDLHDMWRSSLLKMSYLVALLAMHQANGVIGQCIKDVKSVNSSAIEAGVPEDGIIGTAELVKLVSVDALPVLIGMIISGMVIKFLTVIVKGGTNVRGGSTDSFSNPWYYVSAALIPMIVSLHFQMNSVTEGDDKDNEISRAVASSCVAGHELAAQYFDPGTIADIAARTKKHLPVAIVYHTVVTVSVWMIRKQKEQCQQNIELVQSLSNRMDKLKQQQKELKESNAKRGGGSTKKKRR